MSEATNNKRDQYHKLIICVFLAALTLALFMGVIRYGFMALDDYGYIVDNHTVTKGITIEGIRWAFTQYYMFNWHPLTWISHMLDVELFGINPGMFHLTNVLFHILNTVLLFLVLENMTGAPLRCAAVAALFAIHPMHVESVVWISERKDVLSTLFWLLTMAAYIRYVQVRNVRSYLLVILFFILGLLAKPMLVTLPFVLILLDFWPLNRLRFFQADEPGKKADKPIDEIRWFGPIPRSIILEKIPLLVLALISSSITFAAQSNWGAATSTYVIPLGIRVENVITSYAAYLGKMIWPFNLAIFYPYPAAFPLVNVIMCTILLLLITAACLILVKRSPYMAMGWFWYLGTLIPVIGIIQVGGQSMADRYTYVPFVGIFIMVVWGLSDLFGNVRYKRILCRAAAVLTCAVLLPATWLQIGYWKDDETLFRHALAATENNYMAHERLGSMLFWHKDIDGAIMEYQEALSIKLIPEAYDGLGRAYARKNDIKKAIYYYSKGLAINPKNISLQISLGTILAKTGDLEGAIAHFNEVLKIDPENIEVCFNLGKAHLQAGRPQEAIPYFQKVLRIDPGQKTARKYLNNATEVEKRYSAALAKIQDELKSRPRDAMLYIKLGDIHSKVGRHDEAIVNYRKAISLQPGCIQAMYGIALVHTSRGEYDNAMEMLQDIRKIQPENPNPYYNIACLYAKQGKKDESVSWLRQAIEKGFKDVNLIGKDPDLANIRDTQYVRELMGGNKRQ